MVDGYVMWRCSNCGAKYDTEEEVFICCRPEPERVFVCNTCGNVYDTNEEADICCSKSAEEIDEEEQNFDSDIDDEEEEDEAI